MTIAVQPGIELDGLEPNAYEGLARVIARAVGEPVEVVRPQNAFAYQDGLLHDDYDFVFDGPHVIGWRLLTAKHVPIIQLTAERVYVVISQATDTGSINIERAAGRRTCSPLPPRLAGALLLSKFPNPLRQPYLVDTQSHNSIYMHVSSGRCEMGILPLTVYEQIESRSHKGLKIVHEFPAMPGLGMTAGHRVNDAAVENIMIALFSSEGRQALAPFLRVFDASGIEPGERERFVPYAVLLKEEPRLWEDMERTLAHKAEASVVRPIIVRSPPHGDFP